MRGRLARRIVGSPCAAVVPVLIAATTGKRLGEALGRTWLHVGLDTGRLEIVQALQRVDGELVLVDPKTEQTKRTIPAPGWALTRWPAHKGEQAKHRLALGTECQDWDLVCELGDGSPSLPDSVSHGFARIAHAAGVEETRFHDLRHGVLAALGKSGTLADVIVRIVGHASSAVTAAVYRHADDESVARPLADLEAAFAQGT